MEPGEYHWRHGWHFKRLDGGVVRIRLLIDGHPVAAQEFLIPPNEWASIVSHVSARGETGATFQAACDFHDAPAEA